MDEITIRTKQELVEHLVDVAIHACIAENQPDFIKDQLEAGFREQDITVRRESDRFILTVAGQDVAEVPFETIQTDLPGYI